MGREEFADLSDLRRRQAGQHVGEIFLRVQAAPPATDQDGIDHRAAPSRLGMADEEPSLATDRRRANVILDQIVVDLEASVGQIPDQGVVLVQKVIHGFAQRAFRQQPGLKFLSVFLHRLPDRGRPLLANPVALGGVEQPDVIFQPIELAHLADEPNRFAERFLQGLIEPSS